MEFDICRGDIFLAELSPAVGSEQKGERPVLIIQNDIGNYYSPTTIIACLTSHIKTKSFLPTHVLVKAKYGLSCDSIIMLEQIRTIDKARLIKKLGRLNSNEINLVDKCVLISLGIYQ